MNIREAIKKARTLKEEIEDIGFKRNLLDSRFKGMNLKEYDSQILFKEEKEPIAVQILDDMLFKVIRRTKKDYSKAVMDYVRDNHKDVSNGITEVSAEVSKIYKACKEGTAAIEDLKNILEVYHNICAKAIQLHRKSF